VFQTKNGQVLATYLVDGMVAGIWDVKPTGRRARIGLRPLAKLSRASRGEVEREAEAVARFLVPSDAAPEVAFEPP
jgi:hypothetical protein